MTAIPAAGKGLNVRARFWKDDDTKKVWCEERVAVSGDTVSMKAGPEHIQKWPAEYEAFMKGMDEVDVGGTPLTDVPGISKQIAQQYRLKGIRNAEELSAVSDGICSQLGLGALSARKAAQNLLAASEAAQLKAQLAALQEMRGRKEKAA